MRKFHAIALAAVAFFAVSAHAANGPATVPVTGKAEPYQVDSEDFKQIRGSYVLSNGKTLSMVNRSRKFYAQVDGERPVELVPVGHNVFIARDRDMMVLFDEVHNGARRDVVIKPRSSQVG